MAWLGHDAHSARRAPLRPWRALPRRGPPPLPARRSCPGSVRHATPQPTPVASPPSRRAPAPASSLYSPTLAAPARSPGLAVAPWRGPGPCPAWCACGHGARPPARAPASLGAARSSAGVRPLPRHARSRPWHPAWHMRCPSAARPACGAPGVARRAHVAWPWHPARCARSRPSMVVAPSLGATPLPARGAQRGVRAAWPWRGSFAARQCGLARASARVVRMASWCGSSCSRRDA
jgi:hypothetical protein